MGSETTCAGCLATDWDFGMFRFVQQRTPDSCTTSLPLLPAAMHGTQPARHPAGLETVDRKLETCLAEKRWVGLLEHDGLKP